MPKLKIELENRLHLIVYLVYICDKILYKEKNVMKVIKKITQKQSLENFYFILLNL